MINNFAKQVCGCAGDWRMDAFVENSIREIRAKVGTGRVLCQKNSFILPDLKWYFNQGLFRFRNIECKQAVIKMLSISA